MLASADRIADQIDDLLPQTQCGQCGFAGCRPYADAIAANVAEINQCPPGGMAGVRALAALLGREVIALNPANGIEKPRAVALIDEDVCIGCTKCIQACPVDAIIGAAKLMHTILIDECTGCELCIPPCPVDCITMPPRPDLPLRPLHARARFQARNVRLERNASEHLAGIEARKAVLKKPEVTQASVLAAIARGRAKKAALQIDTASDGSKNES
ncbi:electron transport complex subunit RsxB [Pseudolysobacter antarcticus]|uniref:Electron transport complex subunit RsxB n=1 Tax=Pseudolysobacter antarcticus TaxID=2511995 RepID=A0A411HM26_9GAMM|nr:electron transport complex subunit RsxB [Pseudolysobacter antarcticus]QBB71417.1 electron transport complex subunit RsxB [Pseudolysobacter antarcticus]